MMNYKFKEELQEGLIKKRPNRFLMHVNLNGRTHICHCPVTGRIGNLIFNDIPCLVSKSDNPNRKTKYTVEAISLDFKTKKYKKWIGINQSKANEYVNFFLKQNSLLKMITGNKIEREKKLGDSRLDFKIDENYLEVKMPLISLPTKTHTITQKHSKFNSFDRLIKHFNDLGKNLKKGSRAIMLLCYVYDAKPFKPPIEDSSNDKIIKIAKQSTKRGVEHWQINLKINKKGVKLKNYFKLNLFKS